MEGDLGAARSGGGGSGGRGDVHAARRGGVAPAGGAGVGGAMFMRPGSAGLPTWGGRQLNGSKVSSAWILVRPIRPITSVDTVKLLGESREFGELAGEQGRFGL